MKATKSQRLPLKKTKIICRISIDKTISWVVVTKFSFFSLYNHIQGGDYMNGSRYTNERGDRRMAVSKAVVPLLKDDVAKSFMKTLTSSKLKPYTDEQRKTTDKKIAEILAAKVKK